MSPRRNSETLYLFKEWIEKLSFRPYLAQRGRVLSNPDVIATANYPGNEMTGLKFAAKGLLLIGTLATAIGWGQKLFVHEPNSSGELTDSKGRIENIERQLHFYLDAGAIPDEKERDEIARSILQAPVDEGIPLDELQVVIEDQKRKQQGLPTKDSQLALAAVEVLNRVYRERVQKVQQQHKTEPKILQPSVVLQCQDAIDERLNHLTYDDASDRVTNIDEVVNAIMAAPECANYGTAFLESYRDVNKEEAMRIAGADKVRAVTSIKILERAKELVKQEGGVKQITAERIGKLSEYLSPILPALSFIFSGLMFGTLMRFGKYGPARNANRANDAYLFIVTASFFWWNAVYALSILLITELWKFSRLSLRPLLLITVLGIAALFGWGIYLLGQVSVKLERFFSMQPPQRVYQIYRGRRKIVLDIVAAHMLGAVVVFTIAAALVLAIMYYSGATKT